VAKATIIVPVSIIAAGRKNSPRAKRSPPTDSATAAKNPQKVGAKLMPNIPILLPIAVHISVPPVIFGKPCRKIDIPIPTLNINHPNCNKFSFFIFFKLKPRHKDLG